jgi:hypothetical protein
MIRLVGTAFFTQNMNSYQAVVNLSVNLPGWFIKDEGFLEHDIPLLDFEEKFCAIYFVISLTYTFHVLLFQWNSSAFCKFTYEFSLQFCVHFKRNAWLVSHLCVDLHDELFCCIWYGQQVTFPFFLVSWYQLRPIGCDNSWCSGNTSII